MTTAGQLPDRNLYRGFSDSHSPSHNSRDCAAMPDTTLHVKIEGYDDHDHPHRLLKSAPPQELSTSSSLTMPTMFGSIDLCTIRHGILEANKMLHITSGVQESTTRDGGYTSEPCAALTSLPEEIQQRILDMLMGNLKPISPSATRENQAYGTRNWSDSMRHPRAKELTNLALVTPAWRRMVQERLYRHG